MISSTLPSPDAREQALDLQLVGPDALQRRQRAHQHVIHALEVARLLDGGHVLRFFDDADEVVIARVRAAVHARIDVGRVAADRAVRDALLDVADRVDEPIGLVARRSKNVKRQPLRALRADARKPLELIDEPSERFRIRHWRLRDRSLGDWLGDWVLRDGRLGNR